jgi:hypothetical protein
MSKLGNPRYRGEVGCIFTFDVAYEMTRQPVRELLVQRLNIYTPAAC